MADARLSLAIAGGKAVATASRALGAGGGTTLPGRVAALLDPGILRKTARRLRRGAIVLTGTNGKTTTARIIAQVLGDSGLRVAHNRAGANLLSGVTSALLANANAAGVPRADVGLFEVDEAALPEVIRRVQPRVLLITNLFRDQLDRYGEIDYLLGIWRQALRDLPAASTLVLNADDPGVASLADAAPGRVLWFGIDDPALGSAEREHAADSIRCQRCAAPLDYAVVYYAHIGLHSCPRCGARRPDPDVVARAISLAGLEASSFRLGIGDSTHVVQVRVPGVYNVYNALAAAAATTALGVPQSAVVAGLQAFTAAFGRVERVTVNERNVFMALVKNPVGFNQVLRTIIAPNTPGAAAARPLNLLIVINDNFADGTDISWLWDVDFELLAGRVGFAIVAGTRAGDMAVRLKYAGVDPGLVTVVPPYAEALRVAVERTPKAETLYLLPTYTAMLAVRAHLADRGLVDRFWMD